MTNSAHTEENSHLLFSDREKLTRILLLKERVKIVMQSANHGPDSIANTLHDFDEIYADMKSVQIARSKVFNEFADFMKRMLKEKKNEKSPD